MPASADRISRVATRWMIAGEWRAHPARVIVAAFAIAVGVALGFAVHLINASALDEFARAVKTVNGDADLQVHAVTPLGFDEALYPRLARLPGIAGASPVVELPSVADANVSLTLLGVDPFRAAIVTPSLIGRRVESAAPQPAPSANAAQVSTADEAFDEMRCSCRRRRWRQPAKESGTESNSPAQATASRSSSPARCPQLPKAKTSPSPTSARRNGGSEIGPAATHRSEARGRRRSCARAKRIGGDPAGRRRDRERNDRGAAHRFAFPRLSRQSRHAGADGAAHRRVSRLFGAGAFGGAPPLAIRAAARAGRAAPGAAHPGAFGRRHRRRHRCGRGPRIGAGAGEDRAQSSRRRSRRRLFQRHETSTDLRAGCGADFFCARRRSRADRQRLAGARRGARAAGRGAEGCGRCRRSQIRARRAHRLRRF